jgi:hypothetical protein
MSSRQQEPDIGFSLFLACGAGLLTFLLSGWALFSLFLSLGWLSLRLCLFAPCAPPGPLERWLPYVILLGAGVLAALVFAKTGNWALRISTRYGGK